MNHAWLLLTKGWTRRLKPLQLMNRMRSDNWNVTQSLLIQAACLHVMLCFNALAMQEVNLHQQQKQACILLLVHLGIVQRALQNSLSHTLLLAGQVPWLTQHGHVQLCKYHYASREQNGEPLVSYRLAG